MMNLAKAYEPILPHTVLRKGDRLLITGRLFGEDIVQVGDIVDVFRIFDGRCDYTGCRDYNECRTGHSIIHAHLDRIDYALSLCVYDVSLITNTGYARIRG